MEVPYKTRNTWSRNWQPAPEFLPGKCYGQRSLTGYSPQGHRELDTAEHTQAKNTAFSKWCKSGPRQVDSAFHRKQKRLYIQF